MCSAKLCFTCKVSGVLLDIIKLISLINDAIFLKFKLKDPCTHLMENEF